MELENKILKTICEILNVEFSEKKENKAEEVKPATEIKLAAEDSTPVADATATETKPEADKEKELEKVVSDLSARVTALEDTIKQLTGDVAMSKEASVKLSKVVETIASMPASEPIQRTETFSATNNEDEKFKMFVNKKLK